jgi:replicative DNA helicase
MAKIDELAKDKLKASVLVEDVAEHLGLLDRYGFKRSGGFIIGNCLSGKHDSSSGSCCKLNKEKNNFHCFSCNESFDSIDLVVKEKGIPFKDACIYLADNFRRDLKDELVKGEWLAPEDRKKYATANLYEMIYEYGKDLLFKKEGVEAYKYLTEERVVHKGEKKGYDPSKLKEMEWIYWPKDAEIRAHLKKNLPPERHQEVHELKLNGVGGDEFRAALPYRDLFGNTLGFAKRHTSKDGLDLEGKKYRWSYTAGLKKDDLFGLHNCKRSKLFKQGKQLIVVEGLPDATSLPAYGIDNVVAVGQGELSEKHLEGLKVHEVESAIISFDNDKPDKNDYIGSYERAFKASKLLEENGIRTFILPPQCLKEAKDLEEFLLKYDLEELGKIFNSSIYRAYWLPYYYTYNTDLSTDLGKHKALSASSKEYPDLSKGDQTKFRESMAAFFKLSSDELEEELTVAQKRREKEEAEALRKQIQKQAQTLISEGKLEEAEKVLSTIKDNEKEKSKPIEPYTLNSLTDDLQKNKEGLRTGYEELDKYITIQNEAITLVGGRPGQGKTTYMMNLLLNFIKQYPKKNFYFFSYEETRQQIALKLINILAGHLFSESKNLLNLEGYIKCSSTSIQEVETAKKLYEEFVTSGRLRIVGHPYFANELSSQIAFLCKEEPVGAVFIDYIQKIKNKGRFGTRQLELQNTSEILLETAKSCSVPIILGAQLGRDKESKDKVKLDNLREAGDLEQDANLVLGIFNPAMEKAHEQGSQLTDRMVDITITPLKNRNGPVNIKIPLEFDRPILTIQSKGTAEKKKRDEELREQRNKDKEWAL